MTNHPRLSHAQEEIRLRGLRLLARMIARAHLTDVAAGNGTASHARQRDLKPESPMEADRHVR